MPKAKITKAFVDQIPYAEKGQIAYCDTELLGFYLIVGAQSKTYAAQRDMQGRSVRYTIGRHGHFTPEEARKIAKEKLYMMSIGVNPNEKEASERAKAITLESVMESYLAARRNLKPRTKVGYRYLVDRYIADWKGKVMTDITKEMIGARHARIAKEYGPWVANHTMRFVRALFNYAQATFDICPVNPVTYLSRVKAWYKEPRRRSYIKRHQLKDWWSAVCALENDTYRDFLLTLLFTGLRRNEAAQLRWTDIDFKDRTFTIPDTKNGDPLVLPLSEFLFSLFEARRLRYGNYDFVFPGPGQFGFLAEPKKGVQKAVKASGVQFTCHDLRRTYVTVAESLELSSYALKRLINHRATDITSSYIIVDVERLRKPVEQIATFILEHVNGGKTQSSLRGDM